MTSATELSGDMVLAVKDLTYGTPRGRKLIEGATFQLKKGDIALVTGPNGIGKSTLLKIIIGSHKPLAGIVETSIPSSQIAYLPQMQNKTFHLPLLLRDVIDFARPARQSSAFDEDLAHISLLSPAQLSRSWNAASGGERQKALLTMTLMSPSPLILLDEPLNHLDKTGETQFGKALAYTARVRQKTVLLVSHGGDLQGLLGDSVIKVPLDSFTVRGSP